MGLRSTYRRCRFWQKKKIIFSNEAHFDLGGYVNKQNCRIWGTDDPHAYIEKLMLSSWMATLSSCLIWQKISFILQPNEYDCVYAWAMLEGGPMIDLQKMPILAKKNHLFRWSSFWPWRLCKQPKLSHLGHRKADAAKMSHCLVRILVQQHNWAIFLWK